MTSLSKSFNNFVTQWQIPSKTTNLVIINISTATSCQLTASAWFWEYATDIILSRKAIYICLCGVNRENFNLTLKFFNRNFRKEYSDERVLILVEEAPISHQPVLPFSLGDLAAVGLLKLGVQSCPLDLATPLIPLETKIMYIPIFVNFLNKRKLIPTCAIASETVSLHKLLSLRDLISTHPT